MKRIFLLTTVLLMFACADAQKKNAASHKATQTKASVKGSPALGASMSKGRTVYMKTCVSCHQKDGGGVQNMNPPLIKTSIVSGDKQKLVNIVLHGLSRQEIDGETYTNVMPPFNALSDDDIANVLTYVRRTFGNHFSAVTAADVKSARAKQ